MRGLMKTLAATPAALIALSGTALASTGGGGNLPWDGPLQIIENDLSGTVAHVFVIIAIVTTGLFWAFGEQGSAMRKVAGIAAGGSIALGATSFISGLGLGSGAVIGGTGLGTTIGMLLAALAGPLLAWSFTVSAKDYNDAWDRADAAFARKMAGETGIDARTAERD